MPAPEYHAEPALGSTMIRQAASLSVAHALAASERPTTAAMSRGSWTHAAVLEPERWAEDYRPAARVQCQGLTASGRPCSRQSLPGAKHCAQHGGHDDLDAIADDGIEMVPEDVHAEINDAADAIRAGVARMDAPYSRILDVAEPEVSYLVGAVLTDDWPGYRLTTSDDGDILVHARVDIDISGAGIIADLKGVGGPGGLPTSHHGLAALIASRRWYIQAALYVDVVEAVTGRRPRWAWLAHETTPPWAVRLIEIDPADLDAGRTLVGVGLHRWHAYHEREDTWDGWWTRPVTVTLPQWVAEEADNG